MDGLNFWKGKKNETPKEEPISSKTPLEKLPQNHERHMPDGKGGHNKSGYHEVGDPVEVAAYGMQAFEDIVPILGRALKDSSLPDYVIEAVTDATERFDHTSFVAREMEPGKVLDARPHHDNPRGRQQWLYSAVITYLRDKVLAELSDRPDSVKEEVTTFFRDFYKKDVEKIAEDSLKG